MSSIVATSGKSSALFKMPPAFASPIGMTIYTLVNFARPLKRQVRTLVDE